MSILTDITPYIDGFGLVAPNPVPPGQMQGSDNGPMFTAEWCIILIRNKMLFYNAAYHFYSIIECVDKESGLLRRLPLPTRQEGPDDYYGVLAACKEMSITWIPRRFLKAVWRYKGALNNENPGKWSYRSFLIRQPQLLAAMASTAFPRPLYHLPARLLFFPFYLVAAAVILTSCYKTPKEDTDARRLAWHLAQTVKSTSVLCRLASKTWYKRLYKDFPGGMKEVASHYYSPGHPFSKYWVD